MLTFEEKIKIIEDNFPQLDRNNVSMKRVNYQFLESATDKKNVVFHLHPNGNGFVYTGLLTGYQTDDRGFTNIRDFTEKALVKAIHNSIASLTYKEEDEEILEEIWVNENNQVLILREEEDQYNVYAGEMLDGTFNSYGEAAQYLDEEGFFPKEN